MWFLFRLAVALVRVLVGSRSEVVLENLALRHRSLGFEPPAGPRLPGRSDGPILAESVLGGFLQVYR